MALSEGWHSFRWGNGWHPASDCPGLRKPGNPWLPAAQQCRVTSMLGANCCARLRFAGQADARRPAPPHSSPVACSVDYAQGPPFGYGVIVYCEEPQLRHRLQTGSVASGVCVCMCVDGGRCHAAGGGGGLACCPHRQVAGTCILTCRVQHWQCGFRWSHPPGKPAALLSANGGRECACRMLATDRASLRLGLPQWDPASRVHAHTQPSLDCVKPHVAI